LTYSVIFEHILGLSQDYCHGKELRQTQDRGKIFQCANLIIEAVTSFRQDSN